jgi:hypothetical protein
MTTNGNTKRNKKMNKGLSPKRQLIMITSLL